MDYALINEALGGALASARIGRLETACEPEHIAEARARILAEILLGVMEGEDDPQRLQTRALRTLPPPRLLS